VTCLVLSSKALSFTCLQSCECNSVYPYFLSFRYYPYHHHEFTSIETQDYLPAPRSKRKRLRLQLPDGSNVPVRIIIYQLIQHYAGISQRHLHSLSTFRLVSLADTTIFKDETPRNKTHRY